MFVRVPCMSVPVCPILPVLRLAWRLAGSNTHTMCSYCAYMSTYVWVSVKALVGVLPTIRCN